jgi:cytochrome c553
MPRQVILILIAALALGSHLPGALADADKASQCVACHRVDNSHGAPLLDGLPASYLIKQFAFYKSGKRFGPVMQLQLNALAPKDLQAMADYFSSRRPTRSSTKVTFDPDVIQRGLTIASDLGCATCHGANYSGTQEVPRLAGQLKTYLAFTFEKLQRDSSLHPPMASPGQLIPPPSVEALATYFASLEP